jgi:hypothetical protein
VNRTGHNGTLISMTVLVKTEDGRNVPLEQDRGPAQIGLAHPCCHHDRGAGKHRTTTRGFLGSG